MRDISLLDAQIRAEIGRGNRTFPGLLSKLESSAQKCVTDNKTEAIHMLDRRLQVLAYKGVIVFFNATGWHLRRTNGLIVR